MNCKSARENLSAYLDGELEPGLRSRIDAHLADCPTCRAELEALTRTARLVGSLPKVRAPESVLAELEDHLARGALLARSEPEPAPPHRFGFLKTLGGLAAAAVLLLMAHVAWQSIGKVPETDLAMHGALKPDAGTTEEAKTVPTDKSLGGTVYWNKVGEDFFYLDIDSSWEPLADRANEVRVVLAAADLDDARKLIQAAVGELAPQNGYALAGNGEQLARGRTFAPMAPVLDDTLKKAQTSPERTAETTPAAREPHADETHERAAISQLSKETERLREVKRLESEAPAPTTVPEATRRDKPEAEKQEADGKRTLDKLFAAKETLQDGAKSKEPFVVLTVPADQVDALLARLSGTKGLTMKSPTPATTLSFDVTSTELDRTRGERHAGEARTKPDVTSELPSKDLVPGEKGRAKLVRVVIYLEALEPEDTPATPAPTP